MSRRPRAPAAMAMMFRRSGESQWSWMSGSRRRRTVALAVALALSLLVHGAITLIRWSRSSPAASGDDATVVDLSVTAGQAMSSSMPEDPATSPVAASGQTPSDRAPEAAVAPEPDQVAKAAARVAEAEAARQALQGQLESLSGQNAELSSRLDAERERAAELARQLEEAREADRVRLARVQADYDQLVSALQGEIADKVVALRQARERLTVTIVDRVLFPSGQATLTPEGRRTMARVGAVLARVGDRRILVEGHTDDVPIGAVLRERFASNWELSSARATEVVRFLSREAGVPAARLRAAGRADTDPAAPNATDEGRQKNRRIQIILLPPGEPNGSDNPS